MTKGELKQVLDLHAAWLGNSAGGKRAILSGADLSGADLRSADLRGADLHGAYLSGADLRSADLRSADLHGAILSGADLRSADLRGAILRKAALSEDTILPTGETWKVYRSDVVGALLANSVAVEEIVAKSWHVHAWTGCPMAARFHTDNIKGVPALLRPRAEQFIQFFDSGLLNDLPKEMGWIQKK
jgi:Pentapeptide repeats (8 copies)